MRQSLDKYKYLLTLLITALIFGVVIYVNNLLDQQRFGDVKAVQDQIALDILSSETQFDLIKDATCKNIEGGSLLSQEINSLAAKLSLLEANDQGKPSAELLYVKKYYSLLQIKDFILMEQLKDKCGSGSGTKGATSTSSSPLAVLYFYGNKSDCPECEKMSYVLTYLRENYPDMRIYSFDTNLDLTAIDSLKSIYKISPQALPAIVYDDKSYTGFKTIEEMKNIIPALKQIDAANAAASAKASNAATSTGSSSVKIK